jgi:iron complex transport system ATP-binding protein
MIRLEGVSIVRSGRAIVSDVSLSLAKGELLAVVGPNGSGKSTLLRSMLGRMLPDSGRILLHGQAIDGYKSTKRAEHLAWLPQRQQLSEPLPVWEVISAARYRFSESQIQRKRAALDALERVGMSSFSERLWNSLSGGESQRATMATLVAQDAECWLCDEPANHLDPGVQQLVYRQVMDEWKAGQTIVVVTHDLNLLRRSLGENDQGRVRTIGMKDGMLAFERKLSDDSLSDQLSMLYGIHVEEITVQGQLQFAYGGIL